MNWIEKYGGKKWFAQSYLVFLVDVQSFINEQLKELEQVMFANDMQEGSFFFIDGLL